MRPHRGSNPAPEWLKTTREHTHITANRFRSILSRLPRSIADVVSKKGLYGAVFTTIVVKTQGDRRCVKWAFAMRAVVLPWRLGY